MLNKLQLEALELAIKGNSLFITGPGGVGKSYLIQTIVQELTKFGDRVAVTALTGCAALLLGKDAKTIHSWAGIGLGKESASKLASSIRRYNYKVARRWLLTHTLIIDEVSMLTPELLEKLNELAQIMRKNTKPFGGIQVILVGDFFQLPPIYRDSETCFAFESPVWKELNLTTIELTEIIRQDNPVFHNILKEARVGSLSKDSIQILKTRMLESWKDLKIKPTLLFSRRSEVEMINEQNLKALKSPLQTFEVKTIYTASLEMNVSKADQERAISILDRNAPYKNTLELRVGAQVMLIYNLDQEAGLVNGSRGIVEGFSGGLPLVLFKGHTAPIPIQLVSWESDEVDGLKREQIPLILAYAITIHKCQGATLDSALIDIGRSTFEMGQAYVALSRVKSLDSLYIYELDPSAFKAHPKVLDFYFKGV
jgi:ATP-dependent DNA helicase PIF1